ncbi:MAG: hypothetical protein HYS13_06805 [Planctomycetia bacterium]|nr:hypothetical protein [Planctomycetia bacterium]
MGSFIERNVMAMCVASAVCVLLVGGSSARAAGKVTVVPAPGGGKPVVARTDAKGTIHLLLDTADGPSYARSADNGKTFEKPIAVVDRASRKPGLEFHAWDMAVSPDGHVYVAMGTNAWKLKLPKEEWAFHYARLEPGAEAFSPVENINRKPSEGFSLAADGKGNVAACWLSGKLFVNMSHDGGKTFAEAVEIDPAIDPCDCCTTSAAFGADGRLAILYREETDDQRDMYLVLWDPEKRKASRTRVSGTAWQIDSCPMTYFSVVREGEGFLAAWPTKGQVYFARLDGARLNGAGLNGAGTPPPIPTLPRKGGGGPQPPAEIKTPGMSGMRTGVLALSGKDGSTLVAWKKDGQLGWQLYDAKGRPAGPPGSAKSAGSGAAGVATKEGEFVLFR